MSEIGENPRGPLDGDANLVNNGAHEKGISSAECANYYTQWAKKGTYEVDLGPTNYRGPEIAANTVEKYMRENKEANILDAAAGTGFLGAKLRALGFSNVDALEPSFGMLEIARTKQIYQRYILDFLTDQRLDIEDGTYDCLAVAGGMGEGHIPCAALHEMLRIIKPGGHVIIVMREQYLETVEEYRGRLEPLMTKLQNLGQWTRMERTVVPRYSFSNNGIIYVFKITS